MRYVVETVAPEGDQIMEGLISSGIIKKTEATITVDERKLTVQKAIAAFVGRMSVEEGERRIAEINRSRDEDWD